MLIRKNRVKWVVPLALAGTLAGSIALLTVHAQTPSTQPKDIVMSPPVAPEFPAGYAWLNTNKPLRLHQELKGQVVLLDFWTYCCINCMHVLPELDTLQQKYKDQPFAIVGVHSAKYENEQDPANIRAAIQRYSIEHPVIVDRNMTIWNSFNVSAWPTLVLIGSDGRVIGSVSGEGHLDLLENNIDRALAVGRKEGTLAAAPITFAREGTVRAASGLSFPGKIIADAARRRLLIVDSNHNRLIITSWPTATDHVEVQTIIGSGKTGKEDGSFADASFNRPQGATFSPNGKVLYIADTENHLIRRADLEKKTVVTILGDGEQTFDPEAGKSGKDQGLNSPWDVAVAGNRLYIAQAGQHQLFAMNLMSGMTEVAAGTGRENILDGPALRANLAQPSGLALDAAHQILYFADSETSSIRELNLKTNVVSTIIGHGLFDYGNVDGDRDTARFQHCLGVTLAPDGKTLYVADTYNHEIRQVDPATRTVKTVAGTGKEGTGTPGGTLQLFEPASVAAAAEGADGSDVHLFIADTNNHRIIDFQPASHAWNEITIDGLPGSGSAGAGSMVVKDAQDVGTQALADAMPIRLLFSPKLPPRTHFTPGAPISVRITDGTRTLVTESLGDSSASPTVPLTYSVPAQALQEKPATLYVTLFYAYCTDGMSSVCIPAKESWKVTPQFTASGAKSLPLSAK